MLYLSAIKGGREIVIVYRVCLVYNNRYTFWKIMLQYVISYEVEDMVKLYLFLGLA